MKTRYILEKGSAGINEDCLVLENGIFGVFDGATSLTGEKFHQGKTGGMLASQTAGAVFRQNHYSLKDLACRANSEIMNEMVRHGVEISKKEKLWSTSVAVVRLEDRHLEWIQTGDAVILMVYEDGSHKVLANSGNHDHETLTLWKELVQDRMPHEPGITAAEQKQAISALRQALAPQIKNVRLKMNVTYGVLNGEKQAEQFLNHGAESLDGVRDVLLFTDGLSIPEEIPEKQKEFTPLVENYLSMGLNGVKEQIRKQEKTDPLCLTFPRFKCHDDIAAIALSI